MEPRDAEKIRAGKEAAWLLQVAQPIYDQRRHEIITKGMHLYEAGQLDERTAVLLWAGLAELEKFKNALEDKITVGESAFARSRMVQ